MDFKFFYNRIVNIILNPSKAWEIVHAENRQVSFVRNNFFLPLIVIVSLSAFLGSLIFTHTSLNIFYSILVGIKYFVLLYILNYLSTVIFREILKALDLINDFTISFKIITYSLTPLFLCQIISRLFESLIFVNILALYGLYVFWAGTEEMLNPPEHKKVPMLVATFILVTGIFILLSKFLTTVVDKTYFGFFA